MSAEILRRAAALMRDDWKRDPHYWDGRPPGSKRIAETWTAVAEWLEAEATSLDAMSIFSGGLLQLEHKVTIRGAALTVTKSEDGSIGLTADTSGPALAVARAYLGESA